MFLKEAVLVTITISMTITSSFALPYVPDFADPYTQGAYADPYAKDHKKKISDINVQKIKCFNKNTNVNCVDVNQIPDPNGVAGVEAQELQEEDGTGIANAMNNGQDNGINLNKNLVNFCINDNDNGQEQLQQSNGLTVGRLYRVEGPVETAPSEISQSIASCDPGDFVISGGFIYDSANIPHDSSISSIPTDNLDGWSASMENTGLAASIQAIAVCFDTQ